MKRTLLLALVLLAGCSKNTTRPGASFQSPSGVTVFRGYTGQAPAALGTYVAVADARGDDIRLINAVDNTIVLSQTLVSPLRVPVDPRPARLAAGSLNDVDTGTSPAPVDRPWLLVSGSTGMVTRESPLPGEPAIASRVEVIDTWSSKVTVRPELTVDFGAIPGLQQEIILCLAVVHRPVDDGAGGTTAAPGAARLLIGASGGKLVVVDFTRGLDGLAILAGAVTVQELGFEPLSLAASPDLRHLYVASPDPIGTVEGVAELDMLGPIGAWPVRGLDARAPTTHVVAGLVGEFAGFTRELPFATNDSDATRPSNASNRGVDLFGPPVLRVYAAIDHDRCGRTARVPCGLAVIDPVSGGLVPDPAPAPTPDFPTARQAYLTPIEVPGIITGLAFVSPPRYGPAVSTLNGPLPTIPSPLMVISPASGQRYTSAVVMVATTEGRIYVADVGHWAAPSDLSTINSVGSISNSARTRVVSAQNSLPTLGVDPLTNLPIPQPVDVPFIGLWSDSVLPEYFTAPTNTSNPATTGLGLQPDHLYDAPKALIHPWVTPGYTQSETWTVAFQGKLPGLSGRDGQVNSPGSGSGWVAIQSDTGLAGANRLRGVINLYDPALGLHAGDGTGAIPGDIVVIDPGDTVACPLGAFEVEVRDFLYPTADYPGGAVAVAPRTACHDGRGLVVACPGDPTCLDGAGTRAATVTFRASAMLLTGSASGYAGRPPVILDPVGAPLFRFEYEDEDALACPVRPELAWPPPTCDAACRAQCERLALARKARRFTYVTSSLDCSSWPNRVDKGDCQATWRHLSWPITTGPVLAFRLGLFRRDLDPASATAPNTYTARDSALQIATASGVSTSSRVPRSGVTAYGAALPTGLTVFDRSTSATADRRDGMRVYASFPANAVIDFSPSNGAGDVTTIR
jgi:hypothetical protein